MKHKKKFTGINFLSIQTGFFIKHKINNIATNYKEIGNQIKHIKNENDKKTKHKSSKSKQILKTSTNAKYINTSNNTNNNNINSNRNYSQQGKNNNKLKATHFIMNSMNGYLGDNIKNKTTVSGITPYALNNSRKQNSGVVINNNKNIQNNKPKHSLTRLSLLTGNKYNVNNNNKSKSKTRKRSINSIYLKLNDISLCKPFLNQLNQSNHYNTNNSKIISKKKEVLQKPQKHTKLFALYPKKKDLSIKFPHQKNNFSITERITNSITESNNNNINISSRNAPRKVNKTSLTKLSLLTLNENQTIQNKHMKTFTTVLNEFDLSCVLNSKESDSNCVTDAFDDLNSIVRKLPLNKIEINEPNIFSTEKNKMYEIYKMEFDSKFQALFRKGKQCSPKLTNTSRSTQENSNKKKSKKVVF